MYTKRLAGSAAARLALGLVAVALPGAAVAQSPCSPTAMAAGFNGTPILASASAPEYLWFNSVIKPSFPSGTSAPVTFFLNNNDAVLAITPRGGVPVPHRLPNAQITYSPGVATATTTYDPVTNTFFTSVPLSFRDNVFLTGLSLPLPDGLAAGANAVFSGTFTTDTPGASLHFQFAAAIYKQFSTDYTVLGVKPTHGGPDAYPGGDQAGTPESFARLPNNVIGGGTGGGGGNFTGSYSATAEVTPCLPPVVVTLE